MNWRKRRKILKHGRMLVHGTRKLIRINRDLLDPSRALELSESCNALEVALRAGDADAMASLGEKLDKQLDKTFPRPRHAELRENIEVFLVAAIVAMAVRTFFLQPFKIPTGSMQPTLYGIVLTDDCDPNESLPRRAIDAVVSGKWPQHPEAPLPVTLVKFFTWVLFGHWPPGAQCVFSGDHIFVDKISYHFRRPNRGEVIVFETDEITELRNRARGKFYIKRLIGLGGDTMQINPPHVRVNGEILDSRPAFERMYSMRDGYNGYVLANPSPGSGFPNPKLQRPTDTYVVPDRHLFVMGDNSLSSLDGRFWGALPREALVGRAVLVYWPFTKRFGPVD